MADDFYAEMLNWFATFAKRSLEDFHTFTHEEGLTMPQMNVLMRLYYHGPCDMSGLLDTMLSTKAAVSQMVERMVQQGLVERGVMPGDRRARQVSLTAKGRAVMEASITAREGWLKEIGALLTPAQKTEIAHALHTLAAASTRAEGKDMPVEGAGVPAAHHQALMAQMKKKA
jgi:MarR family transcriptional regulator, organic hydroperoxide resistance regulator